MDLSLRKDLRIHRTKTFVPYKEKLPLDYSKEKTPQSPSFPYIFNPLINFLVPTRKYKIYTDKIVIQLLKLGNGSLKFIILFFLLLCMLQNFTRKKKAGSQSHVDMIEGNRDPYRDKSSEKCQYPY